MSKLVKYEDLIYEFELENGRKPNAKENEKIKSYIYKTLPKQEIDGYIVENNLIKDDILILYENTQIKDINNNSTVVCNDFIGKRDEFFYMKKFKAKNIKVFKKNKEIVLTKILFYLEFNSKILNNYNIFKVNYKNGNSIDLSFDFNRNLILLRTNNVLNRYNVYYFNLKSILDESVFLLVVFDEKNITINIYNTKISNFINEDNLLENIFIDNNIEYSLIIDTGINYINKDILSLMLFDNNYYTTLNAIYLRKTNSDIFILLKRKSIKSLLNEILDEKFIIENIFDYELYINNFYKFDKEKHNYFLKNPNYNELDNFNETLELDINNNLQVRLLNTIVTEQNINKGKITSVNKGIEYDYLDNLKMTLKKINNSKSLFFNLSFSFNRDEYFDYCIKNNQNIIYFFPSYEIKKSEGFKFDIFFYGYIEFNPKNNNVYMYLLSFFKCWHEYNNEKILIHETTVANSVKYSFDEFNELFLYKNNYIFSFSVFSKITKINKELFYNKNFKEKKKILADNSFIFMKISNFEGKEIKFKNNFKIYFRVKDEEVFDDFIKTNTDNKGNISIPTHKIILDAEMCSYAKSIPKFMIGSVYHVDKCNEKPYFVTLDNTVDFKIANMSIVNVDNISEEDSYSFVEKIENRSIENLLKSLE